MRVTIEHQPINDKAHYMFLRESYDKVGKETWKKKDFSWLSLEASRSLFTESSLIKKHPNPRKLEVYGLLSGLPFNDSFSNELVKIQQKIDRTLE